MGQSHLGAYSVGMSSGLAVDAGSQLGVHVRCQMEQHGFSMELGLLTVWRLVSKRDHSEEENRFFLLA